MDPKCSLRELWISMDEEIKFDENLKQISNFPHKLRALLTRASHGGPSVYDKVQKLIEEAERLKRRIFESREMYNELVKNRYKRYMDVYVLTSQLLEERRARMYGRHAHRQDIVELQDLYDLFSVDLDKRAHILVTHLSYYCMRRHNYIYMYGYLSLYKDMEPFYNRLQGLGEAVLIMGYRYRDEFRYNIQKYYPSKKIFSDEQFIEFISSSLIEMFRHFYIPHAPHVSFLIVVAFAMEVVYHIMHVEHKFRRHLIKLTVYVLCSVLSSEEFEKCGGLETLSWYGNSVYQGHILAPPFDYLPRPLCLSRYPPAISWDYLVEDLKIDYESPVPSPTRSMERLARLPAGTEAWNIIDVLHPSDLKNCCRIRTIPRK